MEKFIRSRARHARRRNERARQVAAAFVRMLALDELVLWVMSIGHIIGPDTAARLSSPSLIASGFAAITTKAKLRLRQRVGERAHARSRPPSPGAR
jgi:hypothetical protein